MPKTRMKRMIDLAHNYVYRVVMQDGETHSEMVLQGSERGFMVFFNLNTKVIHPVRRSSIKNVTFVRMQQGEK